MNKKKKQVKYYQHYCESCHHSFKVKNHSATACEKCGSIANLRLKGIWTKTE
jgi:Zn finger protein HypA/HybF involved in hydrogenase expression